MNYNKELNKRLNIIKKDHPNAFVLLDRELDPTKSEVVILDSIRGYQTVYIVDHFTTSDALDVVNADCGPQGVGVLNAIEVLETKHIPTDWFFDTLNRKLLYTDNDESFAWLETRDEYYEFLGIKTRINNALDLLEQKIILK